MKVTTNIITTYQDREQEHYNHTTFLDTKCSEYGIEKEWITSIVKGVKYPNELVKLSICVYGDANSKDVFKNKKITNILSERNGKYFFQPDQRDELIEQICKENPYVAEDTLSHKDWLISQGIDPIQNQFNYNLIGCFNHERIDAFKKEYRNLIENTFGDMFIGKQMNHIREKKQMNHQKESA